MRNKFFLDFIWWLIILNFFNDIGEFFFLQFIKCLIDSQIFFNFRYFSHLIKYCPRHSLMIFSTLNSYFLLFYFGK